MTTKAPAQRIDERLGMLLDVERRLEKRVRDAEAEAAERVRLAKLDGEKLRADAEAREAQAGAELERQERAAHAEALAALEREHRAALERIARVTDAEVDALARRALTLALGGKGGAR